MAQETVFKCIKYGDKRLKVTQKQELCVYGYIRLIYGSSKVVSADVKDLCLAFYATAYDQWNGNLSNKCYVINDEDNSLKWHQSKLEYSDLSWPNAFGSFIVCRGDIQTWHFMMTNEQGSRRTCIFGVYNRDFKVKHINDDFTSTHYGWGMYTFNGDKLHTDQSGLIAGDGRSSYACAADRNDVITMTLDLSENESKFGLLSYKINHKDFGVAYDNLPINGRYSMALSMYYREDVKLCDGSK